MSRVNLVVQSFGREHEYLRTIFCIWSFYAHVSDDFLDTKVLLFTDKPEYFKDYFRDLPITYNLLTPHKITQMRGKIDFLHRIKISIIEEAFRQSEGNIVYLDADTFFTDNPAPYFLKLSDKTSFMHTNEYAFTSLQELPLPSGIPFHRVLKILESNEFKMPNGYDQQFPPDLFSWNAGVIMLHRNHQPLLADVYALTDQLFPPTKNHASEQYAFSIVLQTNTELHSCDKCIYHYWYRIKKQIADNFLAKNINNSWSAFSTKKKKLLLKKWTKKLPGYFETHHLTMRDNSIQAFNKNNFGQGYRWACMALIKSPLNVSFIKNCIYHTKRLLAQRYIL